ncbi:Brittle stalk-2-like protein 5 [Zea mays]|uniref:Brittle stalk-2-like protein 5 n=1 Tax=Zea mays TaxID=4577 RepID=A0A1D6IDT2_MAIZE|nr:Brittle stalk-2-like protein 5 [Zea mays]
MVMAAPVPLRRRRALLVVATLLAVVTAAMAQDYKDGGGDDYEEDEKKKPQFKAQEACNGVFLTYTFMERAKEYPHLKKAAAQPYAFKATATVLNTMTEDLKAWQMFVGFQHKEILVSVGGAVLLDGSDLPANVSGGATFAGYPMADLLNSIETAGEPSLIESKIEITGTQFGVKAPGKPMPKTIFNWQDYTFKDWFAAVTMGSHFSGYENVYSFNGTRMGAPFNNTIFMQGVPGLAYLEPITDAKTTSEPRLPGKQQSVISFTRKDAPNVNIPRGEGFPKRIYFDGEECALPDRIPKVSSARRRAGTASLGQIAMAAALVMIVALVDSLCL